MVPVRKIMTKGVEKVDANMSVKDVAKIMKVKKIGSVLVEKDKDLIGIATETDIVRRLVADGNSPEGMQVKAIMSSPLLTVDIEKSVIESDLVIGAVLIKGAKAPVLVAKEMVKKMRKGSVIVDISIDQGGCVETMRPTTHSNPVYDVYGVIHYGVTNIPGAVPRTATFALTNAALPYIKKLADKGLNIIKEDSALAKGVNISKGKITYPAIAESLKD